MVRADRRRLFFHEPEDSFFIGNRSLFLGLVVTFFQFICDKGEVGKAFLGNGNLLVMEYGLLRDGRLGSGNSESGGYIIPWFPVSIGYRDRGQGPGRFSLHDDNWCWTGLVC
jgi:hypothetical protein